MSGTTWCVSGTSQASCRLQMPRPDRRIEAVLMNLPPSQNHVEYGVLMSPGFRKLFCLFARARSNATWRKKSLAQAAPSRGAMGPLFSVLSGKAAPASALSQKGSDLPPGSLPQGFSGDIEHLCRNNAFPLVLAWEHAWG